MCARWWEAQDLLAGHIQQLDGRAANVAHHVGLHTNVVAEHLTRSKADGRCPFSSPNERPPGQPDVCRPVGERLGNLRTGAVELVAGISGSRVSASGTVAGVTGTGSPALWRDGRIYTLPLPPGGTGYGGSLSGITADGHTLVGGGEVSAGVSSTSGPAGDPVVSDRTVPVVWHDC
jgi:hypothetical protein